MRHSFDEVEASLYDLVDDSREALYRARENLADIMHQLSALAEEGEGNADFDPYNRLDRVFEEGEDAFSAIEAAIQYLDEAVELIERKEYEAAGLIEGKEGE